MQSQKDQPAPPALTNLCTRAEYQAQNTNVFPSINSLLYTIRCNKTELIEAGAIIWLGGRVLINPPIFDVTLLDIGRRRAEQYKHRFHQAAAA